MRRRLLLVFIFVSIVISAQDLTLKLWEYPLDVKEKHPELWVFKANEAKANGITVVVCPGGSYHHLGLVNEGREVADYLVDLGYNVCVLRYRVGMRLNHHPAMIEDLQRAVQMVRSESESWKIKSDHVGCMGFSAGGHLVTMAAVYSDNNFLEGRKEYIQNISVRPDFVCPIYPVVSMQDSLVHKKSRKNLLTNHSTEEERIALSMEEQIKEGLPPFFVLACKDDDVVDYRNSVALVEALREKNVPCRFHLFDRGGHGFGMLRTRSEETQNWGMLFDSWVTALLKR